MLLNFTNFYLNSNFTLQNQKVFEQNVKSIKQKIKLSDHFINWTRGIWSSI